MLVTDQQIVNRLTALIDSTSQGLSLMTMAEFVAALAKGRDLCLEAKTALEGASKAMEDDKRENAAAALDHADAVAFALDELSVLASTVRNDLLNLRAADRAKLGAAELSRRATFIRDAFDTAPSRIELLGRTVVKDKLHEALTTLDGSPYVADAALTPLREAVAKVDVTHDAVIAESLDDGAILDALIRARTRGQRRAVSQRQLIEAILGHEDLPLSVDDFVLRRRSKPKSEEATFEEVTLEEATPEPQPEAEADPVVQE